MAKRRYSGPQGGRYRKLIRTGLGVAGRMAGSYIKNRYFNKKSSPETGITAQYDKVTQYSRKSMPKRKKRQWKKFVKKVTAVVDKSLGTRTVVFNTNEAAQSIAGLQAWACAALYGIHGTNDGNGRVGFRDVFRLCNKDDDIMTTNSAGINPSKITFGSAVIDVTMRNGGTTAIEVDLYECIVRTDNTKTADFITTLLDAVTETNSIPGAPTGLAISSRGTTLFDFPNAISMDKIQVFKKRKYFLPVGNTATFQHRDPRNHHFNASTFDFGPNSNSSYGQRGMTKLFLVCAKEIIGQDSAGINLNFGVTRKYSYTINSNQRSFDSYNP